jgi:predicted nucleic acid-binding protein
LALRENKKSNIVVSQVVINEKDLGLQKGVTFNNKRIEKMVRKENNQAAIQSQKFGS